MPYKKFEQMVDLLLKFRREPSRENQDNLVRYQDRHGWPWSANADQIADWDMACRRE